MSKKYSKKDIALALKELEDGVATALVAKKFGIPRTTLQDKKFGRHVKNIGAPTILETKEEQVLVKWVIDLASQGFPITKDQLLHSVSKLAKNLERKNNFKDGLPGRRWYEGFLKRNPEISVRVTQNLTTGRSSITETSIRNWFKRVSDYFESIPELNEILSHPDRVFNCDETAFFLCPSNNKVLVRKGSSHTYSRCANDDKECLTVLVGASANGKLMPSLTLFPYKRIPVNILQKMPKLWGIGKTDSGWMTCESFYEYITNCFYPHLQENNINLPVILFLDGHASHISLPLSNFCREKGIILIALLPNATHILQPMDVAVFRPVKQIWRKKVLNYRIENNCQKLRREDFTQLVDSCIKEAAKPETIKNGFRKCGLYPFNPNSVGYEKILKSNNTDLSIKEKDTTNTAPDENCDVLNTCNTSKFSKDYSSFISILEEEIGQEKLEIFDNHIGHTWLGCEKDENLFYLWKSVKAKVLNNIDDTSLIIPDNTTHHEQTLDVNMVNMLSFDQSDILEFDMEPSDLLVVSTPLRNKTNVISNDNPLEETSYNKEEQIQPAVERTPENPKDETIHSPHKNNEVLNTNVKCIPGPTSENFPTPFKKSLFWPETPKIGKFQKLKRKLTPTVATADEFLNYQMRIDKEKKIKEDKKLKRSNKNNSKEVCKIKQGDFVIVLYEGEKFPGLVLIEENSSFTIKTMTMSGLNWRWPEKDDILTYDKKDIVKKINTPLLLNSRGIYAITDFN